MEDLKRTVLEKESRSHASHLPPGQNPPSEFKTGDWMCPSENCNEHNFRNKVVCRSCQAPRVLPPKTPGDWICPSSACNFNNDARNKVCFNCGTVRVEVSIRADRAEDWTCPSPACLFHNFDNRLICYGCKKTSKPSVASLNPRIRHPAPSITNTTPISHQLNGTPQTSISNMSWPDFGTVWT